jgi:translation initiation factor IF-2
MSMRVYEYAKKIGSSSKEILKRLSDAGFDVANHMTVLAEEDIEFLNQTYASKDKKARNGATPSSNGSSTQINSLRTEIEAQKEEPKVVEIVLEPMTVADIADRIAIPATEVILLLLRWGIVAPKNHLLDEAIVAKVAQHFEVGTKQPERKAEQKREARVVSENAKVEKRMPVIVVLGHVDHGKTTLLDFIRKTRVAAREKGGITQHLGAYQVDTKHGGIVFLDTPGHEAFSKIRSRGVKAADIAILVVAADDGIMPQTIEAIRFAKEMSLPIIVAVNKIDKASTTRMEVVKRQLAEQDLLPEEWGGQTVVIPVSAKVGTGIDELLDMVDLQAQLLELKADISSPAAGYVLESKLEKGRGPVATIILQQGYLRIGDTFIAGDATGRVSSLLDSHNKSLREVGPSQPVQVATFSELPNAGDYFEVISKDQLRKAKPQAKVVSKPGFKEKAINLIIKADTNSSKEALEDAIRKLSKKIGHIDFHIVASGVGDVGERDVQLASNTGSSIVGLHVKATNALQTAQKEGVSITLFDIIYKLLEDLEKRAEGAKEIKMIDKKVGEGVIRKVFDIKKVGIIAGCYVKEGIFSKNGKMVVWRNKHKIGSGAITSLQREGKNIKEVHAGFECAFMADGLTDFAVDDRIECYISVPENKN